jgi:hypothetical protein
MLLPPGFIKERQEAKPTQQSVATASARGVLNHIFQKNFGFSIDEPAKDKWVVKQDPGYKPPITRNRRQATTGARSQAGPNQRTPESIRRSSEDIPLDIKSLVKPKKTKQFGTYRINNRGSVIPKAQTDASDNQTVTNAGGSSNRDTMASKPSLEERISLARKKAKRQIAKSPSPDRLLNKFETLKHDEKQRKINAENDRMEQRQLRDKEVKKRLQELQEIKEEKDKENLRKRKQSLTRTKEKQRAFEEEKKEYY